MNVVEGSYLKERRSELASFLRTRRERVTPEQVGLAPGLRRRTPGLRREEVAQLAGVGVTWYTWLEQGRPINASVQVLDAVARVFGLGPAERWHLYRLADLPGIPSGGGSDRLPSDVPAVLDALEPTAACVYNGRYDLLACNATYGVLFPILVAADGRERNALWQIFTMRRCPLRNKETLPHMVATLRANYGRHVGESNWTQFVADLSDVSDEFAALWATHQVAEPAPQIKSYDCNDVGVVDMRTTSFGVDGMPETRLIVYTPAGPTDAAKVEQLRVRSQLRRVLQVSAAG